MRCLFRPILDRSAELPNHLVPATATTPLAETIVDDSFEAGAAQQRLTAVEAALGAALEPQAFDAFRAAPLLPASAASCQPLQLDVVEEAGAEEAGVEERVAEEEEEEALAPEIVVAVPGKAAAPVPAGEPRVAEEEAEEAEALRVVQVNGTVEELVKELWGWRGGARRRQSGEEGARAQLEGRIAVRAFGCDGDQAAVPLIVRNADFEFAPVEGVCELVEDAGREKRFRVKLPLNAAQPVEALRYQGPLPAARLPLTLRPLSCRQGNVTSLSCEVDVSAQLQAEITDMMLVMAPPLLQESGEGLKLVGVGGACEVAQHESEGPAAEAVAPRAVERPGPRDRRQGRLLRRARRGRRARAQGQARVGALPGQRGGKLPRHRVRHLARHRRGGGRAPALHLPEERVPRLEPLQVSVPSVAPCLF